MSYWCIRRYYVWFLVHWQASKYMEGQLSEEPLWVRGGEGHVQLLDRSKANGGDQRDESVLIDTNTAILGMPECIPG